MAGNTETRRINVFINSELAGASLKSLKAESRKLYNELSNLTPGTDAFIKKTAELKTVEGRLGSVKAEIKGTAGAIGGLPGPLGAATQGVMGLGKQFLALLANPIIAIIAGIAAALMGLYKAFTKTDEGATMVEGGMKALGIIMDKLIGFALQVGKFLVKAFQDPKQALIDIGNFIKDNLINRFMGLLELIPNLGKAMVMVFKGEWSEASKIAVDSFAKISLGIENATDKAKSFGKEITDAIKEGQEMAKMFDDLSDKTREYSITAEKNETQIQKLILASKDKTKTDQERIDLLNQASKLETETFNQQKAFAEEKVALIHKENEAIKANRKEGELKLSLSDEERQREVDAINAVEILNRESIELQQKIANRKNALIESINSEQQKAFEKEQKRIEKETALREKQQKDFEALSKKELLDTLKTVEAEFNQKEAIQKEAFAKGEITELEFNANLKQIQLDRLNQQLSDLQDYIETADGAKEAAALKEAEIANFIAQQNIDSFTRQRDAKKKLIDAEIELEQTKLESISGILDLLSEATKQNADAQKALFVFSKIVAIAEIVKSLQVEKAKNAAANAVFGAAGIPITLAQNQAANIRAGIGIATIVAQAIPQMKFAEGGPTFSDGGNVNKPFLAMAGEAGPEWIAPNWMLRHPVYADVIGSLENVRARGYASGGTTSSTPTPAFNTPSSLPSAAQNQTNDLLLTAINQLINKLDKPFVGVISYDQMVNSMDEITAIKSNASIGK